MAGQFYYGLNTPTYASDTPFNITVPENLVVRKDGTVFLAANEAVTAMVITSSGDYSSWTDITGTVPQTDPIHSLKTARF